MVFAVLSKWVIMAEDDETNPSPPVPSHLPLSPLFSQPNPTPTPLRPSITIVVAVLTAMFSVTFLLLLYARHCKRDDGGFTSSAAPGLSAARRNSGIERSVIESLPIFRFASLRGHKEGLECCVCLNRFEPNEILKLLPKCKHAFHVECVDTWLDAHSTCPLCRYRVDPEDVLLVDKDRTLQEEAARLPNELGKRKPDEFTRRISGRHSSAGERTSNFLQILVERPGAESTQNDSFFRKSVDSAISRKRNESVAVGCFDRGGVRKDGLLLSEAAKAADRQNFLRRFEHRIILSKESGPDKMWSGLRPSDLLFLQSQMMISNTGRYSLSALKKKRGAEHEEEEDKNGRNVINTRCVSEITGLSRLANGTGHLGPRYGS